ncbi:sigma-54 dependent transcriptional regulator [Luteibacter sp. 3190]|uniref:sigma-54-dependent transcriptional regulator n=1 Tax=Luteibacter sp. 3190 TaxID=2817736 RepID=UPI002858374C|nr:sigma-54 dependent transcriptional regulator [Luteibacter sp. 3190]MDR6935603.1 DNA-binding NtrC family response regulator [Luteibacter sp. 3190]
MSAATLLILDDDRRFAEATGEFARQIGLDPYPVTTLGEAMRMASRQRFDCALVDIGLPDGCGLELLAEPRLASTRKIVMSGDASLATWAGRSVPGTLGVLTKPFRFSAFRELLARTSPSPASPGSLLGRSPAMRAVVDELEAVASSRFPVLIHGESGTGKELAARLIHDRSGRGGRFIAVNCAALSAELLASQLFGHRRGSFTGAVEHEEGLVAQSDGGTLFLDELAEAPPTVQAALLRFLESGEVLALGARSPKRVDARVVAATNVDPRRAIDEGRLRADLYFRVAGYEVRMPPLRERPDDIEVIAQAILDDLNREYGTARRFAPGAFDTVRGDRWRGNVRELRQRVQRAWLGGGEALVLDGPAQERPRETRDPRTLDDIEREAILDALIASDGDRAMAAARLGISTRTIYNKLARYRADAPDDPLHAAQ